MCEPFHALAVGFLFWLSRLQPKKPASQKEKHTHTHGYGSKLKSWGYAGFRLAPFTKVPFWYHFFEPLPHGCLCFIWYKYPSLSFFVRGLMGTQAEKHTHTHTHTHIHTDLWLGSLATRGADLFLLVLAVHVRGTWFSVFAAARNPAKGYAAAVAPLAWC